MSSLRIARVGVVVCVLALAGCGGDSDGGDEKSEKPAAPQRAAQPEGLPAEAVARVGDAVITKTTAAHWIEAARRQEPGCGSKKRCREQAMQFLVSAQWLLQESERLGVTASDTEVRRAFEEDKREAFPREKDYREFLETSGRTEADLLFQVRLSVLTNKLQKKTEGRGAKRRRQQRLETFVTRFQRAYKSKTTCRRAYAPKGQCGRIVG
jgi:hypothetical protein